MERLAHNRHTSKTVATHIQRVLAKLGVHSRAQAVAFALQQRPTGSRADFDFAAHALLAELEPV